MRSWHVLLSSFLFLACSSSSADETASSANGAPAPAPKPPGESPDSEERPKDPATSIVVGVDAEAFAASGYDLTHVEIVAKVDGLVAASTKEAAVFPRSLRLDAPKDARDAPVEIEVRALMNDSLVVARKLRTRFVPGASKLAYVYLEVRCNQLPMAGGFAVNGPTCDAALTCAGGKCVSPDAAPLPDYRDDWAKNPPSACGDGTTPALDVRLDGAAAPIADGDELVLQSGPQCGHHVILALAMNDLDQFATTTAVSGELPEAGLSIPITAVPYAWSKEASGRCELSSVLFQVDKSGLKMEQVLGKAMTLKIDAKDRRGRTATIVRHVKIASALANPTPPFCN